MDTEARPAMSLIPIGYLLKKVAMVPDWLESPWIEDIYSLGACISGEFCHYIPYWKHNGWWLFDTPQAIAEVAQAAEVDTSGMTLFYYEAYPFEWEDITQTWEPIAPVPSFPTSVVAPSAKHLEGFDVVCYSFNTSHECSPLCCNRVANEVPVNKHCLLDSLETAKAHLENGQFHLAEDGPYRIIAVYTLPGLSLTRPPAAPGSPA